MRIILFKFFKFVGHSLSGVLFEELLIELF